MMSLKTMNFTFSKRAEAIEEGIFAALAHKKNELAKKGMEVYNFSIGTPDFQPPKHVMDAMVEACKDPENYKYAITDRPELIKAMQDFYQSRFGVRLEADEIMTLYGSQEGMAHVAAISCWPRIRVIRYFPWDRSWRVQRSRLTRSMRNIISCRDSRIFRRRLRGRRSL